MTKKQKIPKGLFSKNEDFREEIIPEGRREKKAQKKEEDEFMAVDKQIIRANYEICLNFSSKYDTWW